jgi:aspartyl-tRNA(Asn)/glutamyl-tRNA(Gln) amidotransferase subunit B
MPKNYQISQYEEPLAEDGVLEIDVAGGARAIGIQRLHLEEDVGKLLHEGTLETAQASLVDFNRSGVALMETVSRPELRSPEEAASYLRAFRSVLIFLGVCDGNMEEGSLRCDANISIRPRGSSQLGTKVEIKNLNSFRNVQHALEFEERRQAQALDAGERIVQETRLWEADRGYTRSMRSKEFAHDYRYFPEPDLVPLKIDRRWVDEIRAAFPSCREPGASGSLRSTGSRPTTPRCSPGRGRSWTTTKRRCANGRGLRARAASVRRSSPTGSCPSCSGSCPATTSGRSRARRSRRATWSACCS